MPTITSRIIPPPQAAAAESAASTVLPTPVTHEPTLSRYAPPAQRALSERAPSPAYWRIGALAAAALLVLALVALFIFRAATSDPLWESEAAQAAQKRTLQSTAG